MRNRTILTMQARVSVLCLLVRLLLVQMEPRWTDAYVSL